MSKKTVATFLVLIMLSVVTIHTRTLANPTTMFVSPATTTVDVGDSFNIDVEIADVTNLTAWEFKLYFNNGVLDCTGATQGPFLKSGGSTFFQKTIDNSNGKVHLACTLLGLDVQVSGSGVLATIAFDATASGESNLHLADTKLGDEHIPPQPIPHTTSDGIVYVSGPANTPPVASGLSITPSSPLTTDDLVGSYTYFDADGDSEAGSEIRWYKNGGLQSAYNDVLTIPSSATAKGQTWRFTNFTFSHHSEYSACSFRSKHNSVLPSNY